MAKRKDAIVRVPAAQQSKKLVEHGRFHERADGTMLFIRRINTDEISFRDHCVSFNPEIYNYYWWDKVNTIHIIITGRQLGRKIFKISKARFELIKKEELTPWGETNIRIALEECEEKSLRP